MRKRDWVILTLFVCILAVVNIVNVMKRQRMERNYAAIVEELAVQISINEATSEELQLLPGIGPSLAVRIVEYREAHGGFKTLESLKRVQGIGDRVFERILPYIKE